MLRLRLKCPCCCMLACLVWLALHAGVLCAQTSPSSAPSASAPSASARESWHFQYDLFQMLLERQGVMPVTKIEQAFAQPQGSVIVIVGDLRHLPARSLNRLSRFVQHGGALLVATDNESSVPGIARFMKGPVTAGNVDNSYQRYADCVKVTAIVGHSLTDGISTIITNRSSWLDLGSGGPFTWESLAAFPNDCLPRASQGQPLLAIGRSAVENGGVIVLSADASLFTNGMLWHGDNAILAIRVSSLLASSDRSRLAFWADGQVMATARSRIEGQANAQQPKVSAQQPLPEPKLSKVLQLANAVATEAARSNVLNETLQQRPRSVRPTRYFRYLLAAATMVLLIGSVWILATSGTLRPFSATWRNANQQTASDQQAPSANLLGDYRAPAGYLAREFCWELTGSRQSADWQKYLARQLMFEPSVSPPDQQDLAKIIDIASRGCRERMTGLDFQRLGKTIATLRAKHAAVAKEVTPDNQPESAG